MSWRKRFPPGCWRRGYPLGFIFLALGLGILLAIIFPAAIIVFMLGVILVCIGCLLIKK